MSTSSSERDPVERLAEEFAARYRDGERPPLSEYTARYPQYAAEIRELFPALVAMEQLKPRPGDLTGDFDGLGADGAAPRQLGEYRLLREVGRGGMGVVYEAEQASLGRRVALKVLPPQARLNPMYLERFKREAKAAAKLHHTNIVPVFGVGEADGVPFYAMQFITGEGLDKVLIDLRELQGKAPGPVSGPVSVLLSGLRPAELTAPTLEPAPTLAAAPATSSGLSVGSSGSEYTRGVARVGLQVAEALAYAHKQGVLHRDVKPSNLLLDAQGTVWVTDFGLAKAEGSDELTGTGDIVGTIRFMAPERFDGRSLPQSDVYALGVTLYELLTLRPAFDDANKAKLIDMVLHQMPAAPRRVDPTVPRDLETVILKCLAKAPEERYATADDLAEDLRRFLADRPIKARRAGNAERLWRWCRRNPAVAGLLAAVALSLLLGTAVAWAFALRARDNERAANEKRAEAEKNWREGQEKLFEAYLAEAKANRRSNRTGQRFETLARVAAAARLARELDLPAERLAELRQVAVTALAMPDLSPRYLGELSDDVTICDLSDDLARVLLWDHGAKTHVVRSIADGAELLRLPATKAGSGASFELGGRYVVRYSAAVSQPLEVWAIDGAEPRLVRRGNFEAHHFRARADGRVVAFVDRYGAALVWGLEKGTEVGRLPPSGAELDPTVALHPTEPLLASCSYFTTRVLLRDYRTGATVRSVDPPWPMGNGSVVWHPDGKRLFVAAGDTIDVQEYHFDPAARQLRPGRLLQTPGVNGGNILAINRAGDRIVNRGWSGEPVLLDLETGRSIFQGQFIGTATNFLRFTPDGGGLLASYGRPRGRTSYGVIQVGDAREVRTIPTSTPGGAQAVVHPGGRLAVIPQGDRFTFVDLPSLCELGVVRRGSHRHVSLAFDGEGRLYSNSFEGCFRWPVRQGGGRLRVGPPERLPFQPGSEHIAVSADGRTVAQCQWLGYGMAPWAGGWLLGPDRADDPFYLWPGTSVGEVTVSPNGRLACFSAHGRLHVVDARTGKLVWEDTSGRSGQRARFTADGRWLVGNLRAHRVGDWGKSAVLAPSGRDWLYDVSPDSRLALLGTSEGYARLVEIATGRELVRIEPPDGSLAMMTFAPDGTKLLEPSRDGLRVWDLRRIRRQLAKYGLDWDGPAYTPAPAPAPPAPLELTVVGSGLLSDTDKLHEYERGLTLRRLDADRADPQAHLDQARWLMRRRKHAEALPHLDVALKERPRSYPVRMNKGLCLFALGRFKEGAAELTAAVGARPEDYRARYWRAQAYKRLGQHALAAEDLTVVLRFFPEDSELYEQRAACHAAADDKAKAAADRALAERWLPRSPGGLNGRAWDLLTGPAATRDAKKALELIRKAIAIEPDEPNYHNTLGVALYRNGRWTEAVAALERSLKSGTLDAFDLYFLALCHVKLGDGPKAKDCFDRAVKWHEARKGLSARHAAELKAFRAEAERELAAGTVVPP